MNKKIGVIGATVTEHIKRFGDYHIDIQQTPNQIAVASKSLESVGWNQLNLF